MLHFSPCMNHGCKGYKEHTYYADYNTVPGQNKLKLKGISNSIIHQQADCYAERKPIKQGLQTIENTFISKYFVKPARCKPYRFKHGKFSSAQGYIGADSVEYIGYTYQSNKADKAIEKD